MQVIIKILLIALLALLTYQDFRHRAISWIGPVAVFCLLVFKGLLTLSFSKLGSDFLINELILFVQFSILIIYFRMKGYSFKGFWKNVMGTGDLLFLVCISAAFAPVNFILFLLAGLVFTMIGYGIMILLKIGKEKPIPFAGLLAVFMIFLLITQSFGKWDSYDNETVLKLIVH